MGSSHVVSLHGFVEGRQQPVVLADDFQVLGRRVQKEGSTAQLAAALEPSDFRTLIRQGRKVKSVTCGEQGPVVNDCPLVPPPAYSVDLRAQQERDSQMGHQLAQQVYHVCLGHHPKRKGLAGLPPGILVHLPYLDQWSSLHPTEHLPSLDQWPSLYSRGHLPPLCPSAE